MLIFSVISLVFAQETSTKAASPEKTSSKENTVSPILYSGIDDQVALIRTAAASKKEVSEFELYTTVGIFGQEPIRLNTQTGDSPLKAADVSRCTGSAMSNDRLRSLTQKADNHLLYYELEKAQAKLKTATDGLVCNNELIDIEYATQTYFLQGIAEYSLGNNEDAQKAFALATRFTPDIAWDDNFATDSKPLFDEAKKEYSNAKEVPLEIIPAVASKSIWVNGIALLEGGEHFLTEGENIIQVLGSDTRTYKIFIDSNVDKAQLVVPSILPVSAHTWIQEPSGQQELLIIANNSLAPNSSLYIHDSGQVWTTQVGSSEWTELEVSRLADARANAKTILGKSMLWTGVGLVAAGSGIAGTSYFRNEGFVSDANAAQSWNEFNTLLTNSEKHKQYYRAGWILNGAGLALGTVGYTLAF